MSAPQVLDRSGLQSHPWALRENLATTPTSTTERSALSKSPSVRSVDENKSDVGEGILSRVAKGQQDAVEECLDAYGPLVWGMVRRWSEGDPEDAVQEIFVEIWQKADSYDPRQSSEASFVALITRRRLIDRSRKHSRRRLPTAPASPDEVMAAPPVDPLEVSDDFAKAQGCMQHLTERQRTVLGLSLGDGVTQSNIAERLQLPLGTVKTLARRALIQIRDCMNRQITSDAAISSDGSVA